MTRARALLTGVGFWALGFLALIVATPAWAQSEAPEPPLRARGVPVVSGAEGSKARPDVEFGVSWLREDRTAVLTRELQSAAAGGRTVRVKDLVHRQTRQVLDVRGAVGLWRDLSLFLAMPIVLADDRWLDFDRRASECDNLTGEGPSGASPSCVNETTSTLLRDGFLPGFGMARYGLDSKRSQPFERPSPRVFQGPTRRGIEYLGVGLSWAVLSQRRDDTRPTWIVRVEPRFALGQEMGFDPLAPEANTGVNPGYHQLVLSTSFSKRTLRFNPQIAGFYAIPRALGSSPYDDFPLGEKGFSHPQHRAGAEAGFEYVGYEQPRAGHKVTFELRGTMEVRFFGLARSELWEVLSGPGTCRTSPATCRPEIDRDLDDNGSPEPYPGITRSPGYGIFGGTAGVNAQIAHWLRLRARGGIAFEQRRFLSDGRSGVAVFDIPGRRWHVEEARTWHLLTDASVEF